MKEKSTLTTCFFSGLWLSVVFSIFFCSYAVGNNIQIKSVTVTGKNINRQSVQISINLSWENSFRNSSLRDAAWIFVKYQDASGTWRHAYLGDTGHVVPSNMEIQLGLMDPNLKYNDSANPSMGVFLFRGDRGNGKFTASNFQLRWNYGANGIGNSESVPIRVFAVEMVHVAEGSFYLGSGSTDERFCFSSKGPGSSIPYQVSSESPIVIQRNSGDLWTFNEKGMEEGVLPDEFPKGYAKFYIMKSEISQQEYVDFLNTVPKEDQANFFLCSGFRNAITYSEDFKTDLPTVACATMNGSDFLTFLNWAALRPMTELEYEKACRGTEEKSVPNEYAWGTPNINPCIGLQNGGGEEELSANEGNCVTNESLSGLPLRVGACATQRTVDRESAGATFYGALDMSGNIPEFVVPVTMNKDREFVGIHGEGTPSIGHGWPNPISGLGLRGGGCLNRVTDFNFQVSDRSDIQYVSPDPDEERGHGGRGVRSKAIAPPVPCAYPQLQWYTNTSTATNITNKENGLLNTQQLISMAYASLTFSLGMPDNIIGITNVMTPIGAVEYCMRMNYNALGYLKADITPSTMWYLPAEAELMQMFTNQGCARCDYNGYKYWSSTEAENQATVAYALDFSTYFNTPVQFVGGCTKIEGLMVRCIHK